ncbi:unnamed protein product [Vitrella brassicaformis CCMP3155]|uniref:K Homology domain-containing protein n=2 Tax=Vitrella brassicaformis TaxID=1169539 RepID=A0A0G4EI90_VITBC|nr:unnamed protein product [Vitrella brassicaformis CCMP3155]|eukprot:CEL95963.1 unnamed protein product [Vitrella brassicaformis CCMP3155]
MEGAASPTDTRDKELEHKDASEGASPATATTTAPRNGIDDHTTHPIGMEREEAGPPHEPEPQAAASKAAAPAASSATTVSHTAGETTAASTGAPTPTLGKGKEKSGAGGARREGREREPRAEDRGEGSVGDGGPHYFKLLVSNVVAGSIIGRSGSVITHLQEETGARLKLSAGREFFPGTEDRVVFLTGQLEHIVKALETVLDKIRDEAVQVARSQHMALPGPAAAPPPDDATVKIMVRCVVPKSSVGSIIGMGGTNVKVIQEESGARVHVSAKEDEFGLQERIVSLSGTFEQCYKAIGKVANTIQQDPNLPYYQSVSYPQFTQYQRYPYAMPSFPSFTPPTPPSASTFTATPQVGARSVMYPPSAAQGPFGASAYGYGDVSGMGGGYGQFPYYGPTPTGRMGQAQMYQPPLPYTGAYGSIGNTAPADVLLYPVTVDVQLSDATVVNLMRSQGRGLTEVQQQSGARVNVSPKTDGLPTTMRRVTVSGPLSAVHTAHLLLVQRSYEEEKMLMPPAGAQASGMGMPTYPASSGYGGGGGGGGAFGGPQPSGGSFGSRYAPTQGPSGGNGGGVGGGPQGITSSGGQHLSSTSSYPSIYHVQY